MERIGKLSTASYLHNDMPTEIVEKIESLKAIIDFLGTEPGGAIYQGANKQLAEILLNCGNDDAAAYHLCESLGSTLRLQTCTNLGLQSWKSQGDKSALQGMRDRLGFHSVWADGVVGLYRRLSELPSEWTAVQLTLQSDPLSRIPPRNRNVNRGLGVFITRFACGDISKDMNNLGEGGKLKPIFLPALDDCEDQLSLMAAMRANLSAFEEKRGVGNRSHLHRQLSDSIEVTVGELETWIGGWHFLFLGRLCNERVKCVIKSAVDTFIDSYNENEENISSSEKSASKLEVSQEKLSLLYLMASSPLITSKQVLHVTSSLFKNTKFALYISKKISDFLRSHSSLLNSSKRYPVVLLLDEELDILPFEVIEPLQMQSFTRLPSIHFLHALYHRHESLALKKGINVLSGYYVINPTKDLPQLENLFKNLSKGTVVEKWSGLLNSIPSKEAFLKGLQESDVFLYCGHGGGNQFISCDAIVTSQIRAVVFLFGCSSSSLGHLGGRVEMTSLSYSYLIAGSPCVMGMLWQVLDNDINAITQEIISVWCTEGKNQVHDLGDAVVIARKKAKRFLNRAAVVVRGLPVSSISS